MSRALKFTLLVGTQIVWILAALYLLNSLAGADAALARALGLEDNVDRRAHGLLTVASIAVLGLGVTWASVAAGNTRPWTRALVAGVAAVEAFTLSGLMALHGEFFTPWLPALASVLGWAAGMFYAHTPLGRRTGLVERVFGPGRVSPATARALAEGRAPVAEAAGGLVGEMTVVSVEIVNLPDLLVARPAADVLARVNRFQAWAADALRAAGGCVSANGAEGVRVVFGPPLPGTRDHAAAACRGALEVVRRLGLLNAEGPAAGAPLDARVGINTGEMFVGRWVRDGYGAAGEEADFARRAVGLNLLYGSRVLLGARTYELAAGLVEGRPLDLLPRSGPGGGGGWREIYELLGETRALSADVLARRDLFWTGVILYRERRYADARQRFLQVHALCPGAEGEEDGPLGFYLRRIERILGPPAMLGAPTEDEDGTTEDAPAPDGDPADEIPAAAAATH